MINFVEPGWNTPISPDLYLSPPSQSEIVEGSASISQSEVDMWNEIGSTNHAVQPTVEAPVLLEHSQQNAASATSIDQLPPVSTLYRTSNQIYSSIEKIAESCPMVKITWPTSGGKTLMQVNVVREGGKSVKERVLVFYGEHARELISPETAVEFLRLLCTSAPTTLVTGTDANVDQILDSTEFMLFPLINPSGKRSKEINKANKQQVY